MPSGNRGLRRIIKSRISLILKTLRLKLDVDRGVSMLLDPYIGEIDAGDKFVFAQDEWEERKAAVSFWLSSASSASHQLKRMISCSNEPATERLRHSICRCS